MQKYRLRLIEFACSSCAQRRIISTWITIIKQITIEESVFNTPATDTLAFAWLYFYYMQTLDNNVSRNICIPSVEI
jgi:hypothetical protein